MLVGGIVIAALVIGIAIAITLPSSPTRHARSTIAAQVDQFAVIMAAGSGDSTPTKVTWVKTTLGPASRVISDTGLHGAARSIPVYAMEISGHFSLRSVEGQPTGTDLWVVLARSNWETIGSGLMKTTPSMRALGSVETDSLAGISPISMTAWRTEYHLSVTGCGEGQGGCVVSNTAAYSNLRTALSGAATFYASNHASYLGIDGGPQLAAGVSSIGQIDIGLTFVSGGEASTGPNRISIFAPSRSVVVMTAYSKGIRVCWGILSVTHSSARPYFPVFPSTADVGTFYFKGRSSASGDCSATRVVPVALSTSGFPAA